MEGHGDGKAVSNGIPPPPFKLPVRPTCPRMSMIDYSQGLTTLVHLVP